MITCPKCSTKNEDAAKFCIKCGKSLVAAAPPKPRRGRPGTSLVAGLLIGLVVMALSAGVIYYLLKPSVGPAIGVEGTPGTPLETPMLWLSPTPLLQPATLTATAAPPTGAEQRAANVELVGQIGGAVEAVVVRGGYAYAGVGARLVIFDISDPAHATALGRTGLLPGAVKDVAVTRDYAYVADWYGVLRIINVSNPAAPGETGFYETPGSSSAVAVAGNYAYVADGWRGLCMVDVSNPVSPTGVGFYDTPGYARDIAVAGNYAFVADGLLWDGHGDQISAGALRIVDVSNRASPSEVASYETSGDPQAVALSGNYAYLADRSGLRIIDVSNPADPSEVGFHETPGWTGGVAVVGNYVYIVEGETGLRILDVFDPSAPIEVGFHDTPGWAWDVALAGDYAYLADEGGLRIIDVSDSAALIDVGSYDTLGSAGQVTLVGNYAYVATGHGGLRIMDLSNPAAPREVGFYDTPGRATDVAVLGSYAYVVEVAARDGTQTAGGALRIIDVLHPAAPAEVGFYHTPSQPEGVAVVGDYAYIADSSGLRIINISDPGAPTELGVYYRPALAHEIAVADNYAYVAEYPDSDGSQALGGGLRIINVSDPAAPAEVGFYDSPEDPWGVAVAGDYAYIADGVGGLRIVNVSSPVRPTEVGFYDTPGQAFGIALLENYAYVADSSGLYIVDVSNPATPTQLASYETPSGASAVAVARNYAYVAAGGGGLLVFRFVGD